LAQRLRPLAATTITTSGTVNLPAFFEPLAAYRVVLTRRRRTKVDGAECGREVIDEHFLDASVVLLVVDNLNIHHLSSLYEAFGPAEARGLAARPENHYTPKHGSWLNGAEIEQRVLDRQRPGAGFQRWRRCRRLRPRGPIGETKVARRSTGSSPQPMPALTDARIKLKRLYPKIDD
jgi:hypothetical protein